MFRNISHIIVGILVIGFAGCAAGSQTADTNNSGYATKAIPAKFSLDSSSLLDDARIYYRVQVAKSNENTRPDSAELIFQIQPGSGKFYLKSRTLKIRTHNKSFEWPGREWYTIWEAPAVNGTITSVMMSYNDLITISEADKVEGRLGGQPFDWPYKSREPMRQFIAYINSVYQK